MGDAAVHAAAGAAGGIVALLVSYPLMTLSTRQQIAADADDAGSSAGAKRPFVLPPAVRLLVDIVRKEGWGALYAGLGPAIWGTAASQAVYYYFYELLKGAVVAARRRDANRAQMTGKKGPVTSSLGVGASLVVASAAGCINVLATCPIWVIVARMQAHSKRRGGATAPLGMVGVARELYRQSGVAGFWAGVGPSLVMVTNPTLQFVIFEGLGNRLRKGRRGPLTGGEAFLVGALAKLGATLATFPLLTIKTRLQTASPPASPASSGNAGDNRREGAVALALRILRDEGAAGLYSGMGSKILQSVLAAAILFSTKEELARLALSAIRYRKRLATLAAAAAIALQTADPLAPDS